MKVICDISVSLDGFITGPNPGPEFGLGVGGEELHEWVVRLKSWRERHGLQGGETGPVDEIFATEWSSAGATIMGKGLFDVGEEPWGNDPPFHMPVFVVTHEARDPLVKSDTTFTFVNGVESAVKLAKEAAGDKNISVTGGADVIQQFLAGGLLNELTIHLVPVLLGGGVRLFGELEPGQVSLKPTRVIDADGVAHLTYRVSRGGTVAKVR